jgi:hypothetical protein
MRSNNDPPRFRIARLIPALREGAEVTVELAGLTAAICLVWGVMEAASLRSRVLWLAARPATRTKFSFMPP